MRTLKNTLPDDNAIAYRKGRAPVPERHLRWNLRGAGLDNLSLVDAVTPPIAPDRLLVRHDACGICYSDVKIVGLGPDHPRLVGRDLDTAPVVMGHEVALTVVQVGAERADRFAVGQRYIVQADVYFGGQNLAYGYVLDGGMSQYSVIGREVLEGDEGVYLLPIADSTGYVEAALIEPWACVVAAYKFEYRAGLAAGGSLLAIGFGERVSRADLDAFARRASLGAGPAVMQIAEVAPGAACATVLTDFASNRFTDIVLTGSPTAEDIAAAAALLAKGGMMNLATEHLPNGVVALDLERIHYDALQFVGGSGRGALQGAEDNYRRNLRADLAAGGSAWFIGAGGPMGQMHVQRAVLGDAPPRRIVVTDRHAGRLQRMLDRFQGPARRRGIEILAFDASSDESAGQIDALGPFDDIVCMVPSAPVVAESIRRLADGGVYNLFAGAAKGVTASLDLSEMLRRAQRLIGTSGSHIADMASTLGLAQSGKLSTSSSLAAIGGLKAFRDGLAAVKAGPLAGKIVIFPHLTDLPLTTLAQMKSSLPRVYERLADEGRCWTNEAEQALLADGLSGGR